MRHLLSLFYVYSYKIFQTVTLLGNGFFVLKKGIPIQNAERSFLMSRFYYEKPLYATKNRPIEVKNEKDEIIGQLVKLASKITFSKNHDIFAHNSATDQELGSITLEIGWLGEDGVSIVYHDKQNNKAISFVEKDLPNYPLHIISTDAEFPIEIIRKQKDVPIIILFHGQESAVILENKKMVEFEFLSDNTNIPDHFFFLVYFIQKLMNEES